MYFQYVFSIYIELSSRELHLYISTVWLDFSYHIWCDIICAKNLRLSVRCDASVPLYRLSFGQSRVNKITSSWIYRRQSLPVMRDTHFASARFEIISREYFSGLSYITDFGLILMLSAIWIASAQLHLFQSDTFQ